MWRKGWEYSDWIKFGSHAGTARDRKWRALERRPSLMGIPLPCGEEFERVIMV